MGFPSNGNSVKLLPFVKMRRQEPDEVSGPPKAGFRRKAKIQSLRSFGIFTMYWW